MPRASARCLTGEAVRRRPRPAGRSGCVYTAAISCPAAASASSAGTAKSGVPAKTSRNARFSEHAGGGLFGFEQACGFEALLFLQLLANAAALEIGQVVHEQLAVEVIDLVLHANS